MTGLEDSFLAASQRFNQSLGVVSRKATVQEYADWFEKHLAAGGRATHFYEYPMRDAQWMLIATADMCIVPAFGSAAGSVIVPEGVNVIFGTKENPGDIGHNKVYTMKDGRAFGGIVPMYQDVFQELLSRGHLNIMDVESFVEEKVQHRISMHCQNNDDDEDITIPAFLKLNGRVRETFRSAQVAASTQRFFNASCEAVLAIRDGVMQSNILMDLGYSKNSPSDKIIDIVKLELKKHEKMFMDNPLVASRVGEIEAAKATSLDKGSKPGQQAGAVSFFKKLLRW